MKVNFLSIATGIIALISIFLPWFSIDLWTENLSSTMSFSAYLYQLSGTVEGVTKSVFMFVWFNSVALILTTGTVVTCVAASVIAGKKRRMLLALSLALALLSLTVFAYGLISSDFAVMKLNPGYTISQFPDGAFGLSAGQSMLNSYDYSWAAGLGFWLVLIAAVLTVISAVLSQKR